MKRYLTVALFVLFLALGALAGTAGGDSGNGQGNGPPASNPGSPGDDCSHGNADKPCKDDPQPDRGKDCEDHGNARGNEDHCEDGDTTVPEEPPVETTTPEEPPVVTTTPEEETSTPSTPSAATGTTVPATAPTSAPTSTPAATKPKAKPKAATKIVKVQKQSNGIVKVTTADGKTHTAVMGAG